MGGYKPYKAFLFKISETAKVNHFNILVDLCHQNIGKIFLVVQVPLCVRNSDRLPGTKSEVKYLTICNAALARNWEKVQKFSPRPQ
jgi:hypothetical protein